MLPNNQINFVATAFISCSLRNEDRAFVEFVERILIAHRIKPIGTVGRHSAAPLNPAAHMKKNIPLADFVVIIATPRYLQKDLKTGKVSYGLSEMVHVETGMASMLNKPVVAFVKQGTEVGSFLPHVTEYITLNGEIENAKQQSGLITSLLSAAHQMSRKVKEEASSPSLLQVGMFGFALVGVASLLGSDDDKPKRRRTPRPK